MRLRLISLRLWAVLLWLLRISVRDRRSWLQLLGGGWVHCVGGLVRVILSLGESCLGGLLLVALEKHRLEILGLLLDELGESLLASELKHNGFLLKIRRNMCYCTV